MSSKPGFCYEIYKNQSFWSHNQSITYNPCSFYDGYLDLDIPPDQVWFGTTHRKVIQLVEQGQTVPGCHKCYTQESLGLPSRRQASRQNYEEFLQQPDISQAHRGPQGLDYSVGNLCNLRCVICGPHNSSSWIPDHQKIYPDQDVSQYLFRKNQTVEIENDEFLSNIISVHFHGGGEPLMNTAHVKLLHRIQRVKGLGDVRVFYNTNGTHTVDQEVLDLWQQCRLVEIYFSIDDVGHRFEYQRTGAAWNQVQDTMTWFYHHMPSNHLFNINCVWSYLNLYYLDELWNWHRSNFSTNRYGDACNLILQKAIGPFAIEHLSPEAWHAVQQRLGDRSGLRELLPGIEINHQSHDEFWQAITRIDTVRNNDFRRVCPEWSELL